MASREKYLEDLEEYLENCQANVTAMLDGIGWTPDYFIQPKKSVQCPHDSNHIMSPASLEKHQPICELIQKGCTKEEAEKILDSSNYFYEGASCVYNVKFDIETLNSALWNHHVRNHSVYYGHSSMPLTPDQEAQMLSREDRLGLAEYVIARSRAANRLATMDKDELMASANLTDLFKTDEGEKRPLDHVEEMAALRDYRRRRQSYRAKNVHITKKSHTEIMREVINNQMEMYSRQLQEEIEAQSDMQDRVNRMLESVKEEVEEEKDSREPSHTWSPNRNRESATQSREGSKDRTRERYSRHKQKKHKKRGSRSRSRSRERSRSKKKHKKHKHRSDEHSSKSPAINSSADSD